MARGILQRVQLKPGIIIRPRDHWPRPDGRAAHCCSGKPDRRTEREHRSLQGLSQWYWTADMRTTKTVTDMSTLLHTRWVLTEIVSKIGGSDGISLQSATLQCWVWWEGN